MANWNINKEQQEILQTILDSMTNEIMENMIKDFIKRYDYKSEIDVIGSLLISAGTRGFHDTIERSLDKETFEIYKDLTDKADWWESDIIEDKISTKIYYYVIDKHFEKYEFNGFPEDLDKMFYNYKFMIFKDIFYRDKYDNFNRLTFKDERKAKRHYNRYIKKER